MTETMNGDDSVPDGDPREWKFSEVLSRPWRTRRETDNCCGRVAGALGFLLVDIARLSCTVMEIRGLKDIGVTTLIFGVT